MSNIGHVQYSKGKNTNELKAVWVHAVSGRGTGLATGESNAEFEGEYLIKYFDESGAVQAELDLEIIRNDQYFDLIWRKKGVVTSVGIGMENANILSAGYCDVL